MKSYITGDIFTTSPKVQTLKAWEPWGYTCMILFELQNSDIGDEFPEWRLNWFSGVTILRTVGYVLHKVDSKQSSMHKKLIKDTWDEWNKYKDDHWIFWDFIEKERNNIIKEFSFGAELPKEEDDRVLAYGNTDLDAAQLFREAVYWWRNELCKLESQLNDNAIQINL